MASKTKASNTKVKVVKTPEQKNIEKIARMNKQFRTELICHMESKHEHFVICIKDKFDVVRTNDLHFHRFDNAKVYMKVNGKLVYLKNLKDAYKKIRLKLLECKDSCNKLRVYRYTGTSVMIETNDDVRKWVRPEIAKVYLVNNGKFRLCKDELMFDVGSVEYDKIQLMLNKPMNALSINEINTLNKHKLMPESNKDKEIERLKEKIDQLKSRMMLNSRMGGMMIGGFGCR